MSAGLHAFYDAFLGAVDGADPRPLADFLDDRSAVENAIVYRNTIYRGAADALATAFPATARLAGGAYFEAVAVAYIAAEPPQRRSLVGYGASFADFLARAPGIEQAPYIPDAARLDRAWLSAHLAPAAGALRAEALGAVAPERLDQLVLRLHPSAHIVDLSWSVHDAWKDNRGEDAPGARAVTHDRQTVLLWRLNHEVQSQILSGAEARFFQRLAEGLTLGAAAAAALACAPDFNLSLVFAGALEAGLFDDVQPDMEAKREEWW